MMEDGDENTFGSVQWDNGPTVPAGLAPTSVPSDVTAYPELHSAGEPASIVAAAAQEGPDPLSVPKARITIKISDPNNELEGTKDMFTSYLVSAVVRHRRQVLAAPGYYSPEGTADRSTKLYLQSSFFTSAVPRLYLPARTPHQGLSCLSRSTFTRQASTRWVPPYRISSRIN
jgi:hypothetical protein